jgi:UPF0755 protein
MLKRIIKGIAGLFLLGIMIAAAGIAYAYWLYENELLKPLPVDKPFVYQLPAGTPLIQVARDLKEKQLLTPLGSYVWLFLARWEQQSKTIKSGEYPIPVGTTPQDLLAIFISGQTVQYSLTIPEGLNFREMLALIHRHDKLIHTLKDLNAAAIMEKLGYPDQHPEGRFYPDTYYFPANTTDLAFLQRAHRKMRQELAAAWDQRSAQDLPLRNADEALILASLIEKETADPSERHHIAGVFVRRLQRGMLLQTDPTVIYALGEAFDGNIRQTDLRVDNPYNTYRYAGLPPTPIALPGRASLLAAVQPQAGETLFFVAKGNGSHYFSRTLAEHECAVIQYQIKDKNSSRFRTRCRQYPQCEACRS